MLILLNKNYKNCAADDNLWREIKQPLKYKTASIEKQTTP